MSVIKGVAADLPKSDGRGKRSRLQGRAAPKQQCAALRIRSCAVDSKGQRAHTHQDTRAWVFRALPSGIVHIAETGRGEEAAREKGAGTGQKARNHSRVVIEMWI